MKKILNYHCTSHFLEKMRDRRIDSYLVSLCLSKGKKIKTETETKYTITKKEIKEAIIQGYIGIETLTVVTFKNRLITAFSRYSDIGLN